MSKTIAENLGIRDGKSVTIPVSMLYQEHTMEQQKYSNDWSNQQQQTSH